MAETAPICDFGWQAVDATLPGVDGKQHRLFASAGHGGLVVAFICNHCPYVKAIVGRIVRDAEELKHHGIGFVAINSNDPKSHPEDSFDNMKLFSRKNGFPFHYLFDEDQAIARAYGAVCTPDFFGLNGQMQLQYRGRLDASRKAEGQPNLRRDLFEAMAEVARSGKGPREQIASIGCSIKWHDNA